MDVDAVHSLGEEVEERVRTHSAVERTVLCGGWDSKSRGGVLCAGCTGV